MPIPEERSRFYRTDEEMWSRNPFLTEHSRGTAATAAKVCQYFVNMHMDHLFFESMQTREARVEFPVANGCTFCLVACQNSVTYCLVWRTIKIRMSPASAVKTKHQTRLASCT